MMDDLPNHLISEIQKYTNAPWWNGQAYVEFKGYHALAIRAAKARSELDTIIAELRQTKDYAMADRLRSVANGLDAAVAYTSPKLARNTTA